MEEESGVGQGLVEEWGAGAQLPRVSDLWGGGGQRAELWRAGPPEQGREKAWRL